jgi:hypothetical protein
MKGNRKLLGFCLSLASMVALGIFGGQDVGMAIASAFAAFAGGNAVEHIAGRG